MKRPLIIGHRGAKGLAPDNSVAGFCRALEIGADGVEFDVHLTHDGAIAVIHDAALGRTTTGRGPVGARTAAELAALSLKRGGGAIPMLGDVAALLAPTSLLLNVEIKTGPRHRPYPGLEAAVADILAEHNLLGRAVVSSFDWDCVARFCALARPHLALGLLDRKGAGKAGGITHARGRARARGLDGICAAAAALRGHKPRHDGALWVYGANDAPAIRRAMAAGVDAVITDRPDLALRLRAEF